MFADRKEAGRLLASKLEEYRGRRALVFAIPRGGVVVGYEVARELALPLDIIAVRKIGYPSDPECAIGAVDEHGTTIFDESFLGSELDAKWIKKETEKQKREAIRRSVLYRGGKKSAKIENKVAIIVDDGIATGLTARLAVRSLKAQRPDKIIVAAPVASVESVRGLEEEGAEVIVLEPPEQFMGAVGAHYAQFDQIEDEKVVRLLR